jgi:putative ABC transport system substrate-binding protein
MRRLNLLFVAVAAVTAANGVQAQQKAMPVVGYLSGQSINARASFERAFHAGLEAQGFREGSNIVIEYRSAEGQPKHLDTLAADLVRLKVSVIAATGGPLSGLAAKRATNDIPIVFTSGLMDPVNAGLVSSLNRPGGNLTGVYFLIGELVAKRLALMKELLPSMTRVAVLTNPSYSEATAAAKRYTEIAASKLGLRLQTVEAATREGLSSVFDGLAAERPDALFVSPDPFFTTLRADLVALAARHRIPVSFGNREYVESGGLMSYGPDIAGSYHQVGAYVGRILKGDRPADLPVVQPTKYELALNLRTAKALGIEFPATLLAIADEVIE